MTGPAGLHSPSAPAVPAPWDVAPPSPQPGVAAVADSLAGLLRTVRRAKSRHATVSGDDVESVTGLLLRTVAVEGPMRASALALSVHSDLSTVSRQVAALVAKGLLERRADPLDGRACLLAVTELGDQALAERERMRGAFFAHVLDGWGAAELERFAASLERLTDDYDRTHAAWMAERAARQDQDQTQESAR
jgi:DNA-binding MarR family transcriptional regulator